MEVQQSVECDDGDTKGFPIKYLMVMISPMGDEPFRTGSCNLRERRRLRDLTFND